MLEISEWLKTIEKQAEQLYSGASARFASTPELSALLNQLAIDEAWHYHLIGSASDYLRTHDIQITTDLTLDEVTKNSVEGLFFENLQRLAEGSLTESQLLDCLATTEFSEWNPIFLYVVNKLKESSKLFQYGASMVQTHQQRILGFLESVPMAASAFERIQRISNVWQRRVLVVDDNAPLRELLEAYLETRFSVTTAENGAAALQITTESFFDVIVTDIDMPIMNGVEFFERACANDPNVCGRFLFCSGMVSRENKAFMNERKLPYLLKPFTLIELKAAVEGFIRNTPNTDLPERGQDDA